jgi:hypothetical protein
MRTRPIVGLAVLAGALGLAGAKQASASAEVRLLAPDEVAARKVGLCDNRCSLQTAPCPTTTAPADRCADSWRTTRDKCLIANDIYGGCVACSAPVNYRICVKFPAVNCTPWGSANQTCGFMKQANCNWTGTVCMCPGLPAKFSGTGCNRRDCSSP